MLITATDVVCTASDCAQLIPMLEQAEEMTGKRATITLADGGYHTAANLEAGERRTQTLYAIHRAFGEIIQNKTLAHDLEVGHVFVTVVLDVLMKTHETRRRVPDYALTGHNYRVRREQSNQIPRHCTSRLYVNFSTVRRVNHFWSKRHPLHVP